MPSSQKSHKQIFDQKEWLISVDSRNLSLYTSTLLNPISIIFSSLFCSEDIGVTGRCVSYQCMRQISLKVSFNRPSLNGSPVLLYSENIPCLNDH